MYPEGGEPQYADFLARLGPYIKNFPLDVADITGAELGQVLGLMAASGSSGMDGWRVAELKALPEPVLNLLADLFNCIESSGRWPLALERALVSLIPKGQGCRPLNLRPISVMSVVYRLWAVRRLHDLKRWQEGWAAMCQHGFHRISFQTFSC